MSTIKILPLNPSTLTPAETSSIVTLYTAAFAPPSAGIFMSLVYPTGLHSPAVQARLRAFFKPTAEKDTLRIARDPATDELLGVIWWQLNPASEECTTLDEDMEKTWKSRPPVPNVPGMNHDLDRAYFEASFAARHGLERPFVELRLLAVHPEHQGKGVGEMLVRDGLKELDEMKMPAWVCSARQGKLLYEKCGFEVLGELPLDGRDHGGETDFKHWCMWRPART